MAEHQQQRSQLAELGQQQAVALLAAGKALLDASAHMQQPSIDAQQRLAQLQQAYLQVSADIRATLQQCRELEQQQATTAAEAAAAAAAAASNSQGQAGADDAGELQQLQAQADALREAVESRNQLIKRVMDQLRHLVDAFSMWDSHHRHLLQHAVQYAAAGAGAT